jgi:hypothetical protein
MERVNSNDDNDVEVGTRSSQDGRSRGGSLINKRGSGSEGQEYCGREDNHDIRWSRLLYVCT